MDRKLRVSLIAALVAVAIVGTALVVTHDHRAKREVAVTVSDQSTTTATSADDTTSTTEPIVPGDIGPPVTTATTTTTLAPATTTRPTPTTTVTTSSATTTTTAGGPHNGTPVHRCTQVDTLTADGLSVSLCQEGSSVAGEPTSLHLTASDGDARVRNDCGSPIFEWGDEQTAVCTIGCDPMPGPSDPSSIDITRDHTYASPGSYTVQVTVESNCGAQPYGERHTVELTLDIKDPNQPPDGTG